MKNDPIIHSVIYISLRYANNIAKTEPIEHIRRRYKNLAHTGKRAMRNNRV